MLDTPLGGAISQRDPVLKPGDIDDCAVVGAFQAAHACGGKIIGLTIPEFRAKAGRPDVPGVSNGMTADDVLRGAVKCWPLLQITKSSPVWETFRAAVVGQRKVFAVAVLSGALPADFQYGFKGLHEISGRAVVLADGSVTWYIVNPLQLKGSPARKISEAALKKAIMATGKVSAVLFAPAKPPVPAPVPTPVPDPTPVPVPVPAPAPDPQVALNAAFANGVAEGIRRAKEALEAL